MAAPPRSVAALMLLALLAAGAASASAAPSAASGARRLLGGAPARRLQQHSRGFLTLAVTQTTADVIASAAASGAQLTSVVGASTAGGAMARVASNPANTMNEAAFDVRPGRTVTKEPGRMARP
ncbi:hypothetical protein HT031_004839 [Scenedesmus sp. PABB004]|nr:hypothetical protein HT031_004839 [Scenedesmus sp. PABB004]